MNKKSVLTKEEEKRFLNILGESGEEIEETAKLSWDGSSVLLRLPKGVADYFKINKGNVKSKEIFFSVKEEKENGKVNVVTKFEIKKRSENGKKQEEG